VIDQILSRYRAAIFDLDGTLADSMNVWDSICRDSLAARGIAAESPLEKDIETMTLPQAAEYVVRRYGLAPSPEELLKEWEAMVTARYEKTVKLKAGAAELVRALEKGGVKLAIATSSFPAACEALLSRQGLRDCFSALVYTHEAGRDKTFPDIYLACAKELNCEAADCLVFEDFPLSLSGVKAAGMDFVAVYDSAYAGQWDRHKNKADFAVFSFLELL
jgi:HAD superfamily hydrolase (TIGR01509 family)